ncbi:MAG: universal stress protein [Proteobacteria bacterium]|nr:universal stress protein [Pseudomonadota bacterium]
MLPQVKTILYCTQMGPRAALIFRYAYLLAEKLDARIVALHVVETLSTDQEVMVERYVGAGTLEKFTEREEQGAAAELERRIRVFCRQEVGAENCDAKVEKIVVAEGQAATQILRHVGEQGADLVVMGAHARSPVMKAVLGSTAQRVIRGSPVPVLLVRIPEDQD